MPLQPWEMETRKKHVRCEISTVFSLLLCATYTISLILYASYTQMAPYRQRYFFWSSQLLPLNERFESLHEILNAQLFALPLLLDAINLLWRNQHAVNYLNNPVFGDTIFNGYSGESIDFDNDNSAEADNINAQRFLFERSLEINLQDEMSQVCRHGIEWIRTWNIPLGIPVSSTFSAL